MAKNVRDDDDDIQEEETVVSRVSHVVLGRPRYAPAEDGESGVYAGPPQFYPGGVFTPVGSAGKAPKRDYRLARASFQDMIDGFDNTVEHLEMQVKERDEAIEKLRQENSAMKQELKTFRKDASSDTAQNERLKKMQAKLVQTQNALEAYHRLHEKLLEASEKNTTQKEKFVKMLKDAGVPELQSVDKDGDDDEGFIFG